MHRTLLIAALALLPACIAAPAAPSAAPDTSPALLPLERDLRTLIASAAPHDSLEVAVALIDLESGDSLLIDGHVEMHAASTMKVPVLVELFRRADAGEIDLDAQVELRNVFTSIADGSRYSLTPQDDSDSELYPHIGDRLPIEELMRRMITRSSNLATNILIELAGPERIAATLADMGASEMKVLRGVEDIPAFERGMNNTTTAYGFAKVMAGIAAGGHVSPVAAERIVRILEAQEFREKIPAGLPAGTRVGNKTGWITGIRHDGAIVYPEGRAPYALVVLTRGFRDIAAADDIARRISTRVWDHLMGGV